MIDLFKPVRMAMIGGGNGALIGPVHRIASQLDSRIALVAGAFSSKADQSRETGRQWGIADDRAYADWQSLLRAEAARPDGAELIAIVTPNDLHYPIAVAALEAGFHVMSDKPATTTLEEALRLQEAIARCDRRYGLTYTYSGYPLVRQAREMIAAGEIGTVRKVVVEYVQGWLSSAVEAEGSKQAQWRVDPARSGPGGCIGDIGVHAFHLAEFVTGSTVSRLLADLAAVVPGRVLDDDCTVLLKFDNGARGVIVASQISIGELNGLRLRVYGDKGSLDWRQEEPNRLTWHKDDGRTEILRTGTPPIGPSGAAATRIPGGHPEGYLEAFANIYRDFADSLREGVPSALVPGIEDGVRSLAFVEAAVTASRTASGWVSLEHQDVPA
ncbi:oxidoreductase domain protein [Sphingobium chlorophenolicum L-1]|uniref:Oxidoreductase domain protein n=1 Tax=Sphingobium chlorophenolicum L-1 TaxID=690566 RepID=F6F3C2_SPHCR|nr:Gfo/Idh/MocA family oxidoreductase [Sphingobium chlorophenolicum]AEG50934.1 oxidoreductase domain protein [Sphingobium chlorophenolicum L-1]